MKLYLVILLLILSNCNFQKSKLYCQNQERKISLQTPKIIRSLNRKNISKNSLLKESYEVQYQSKCCSKSKYITIYKGPNDPYISQNSILAKQEVDFYNTKCFPVFSLIPVFSGIGTILIGLLFDKLTILEVGIGMEIFGFILFCYSYIYRRRELKRSKQYLKIKTENILNQSFKKDTYISILNLSPESYLIN